MKCLMNVLAQVQIQSFLADVFQFSETLLEECVLKMGAESTEQRVLWVHSSQ